MTDKDESIITHIEALRTTLIKCLSAIGIVLIPSFFAAPKCMNILISIILRNQNIVLNYFSPMEVFIIQIKTAFILDIIICFPYIAKQIWDFCLPALYEHEKKFITSIVFTSSLLFVLGSIFCLFVILPLIINFGLSFSSSNIQAVFGVSNIISLSLFLVLSFGIIFQMPLITYSLIKSDIVSYKTVTDMRPYVITGLLIIAGILTPPDIISQLMLAAPAYLLFEAGLLFARFRHKS